MNLPGFDAEASLYRSAVGYRLAATSGPAHAGVTSVTPQSSWCYNKCANFWWNCHETCRQVGFNMVCIDRCLGMTAACEAGCDMLRV
jgi:hypothetical protein